MTTFVLPGMGATSEMYPPPWNELENAVFVDWPAYRGESSMEEVATRVIEAEGISAGDVVIGSSLGGMVALEIAQQLDLLHVVLLGSAVSAAEVNVFLRLAAPLAPLTPLGLSQVLGGVSSGHIGKMFQKADPAFVVAMSLAVAKWQGVTLRRDRLTRIHGTKDRTIPSPKDVDVMIQGAGHLLAYTHPRECMIEVQEALLKAREA